MTDRYGVMGHPIGHSKSPMIHTRFAEQTDQSITYQAIHVLPGELSRSIGAFHAEGGKGLSITLPFKEEAKDLATILTSRAQRAGAVNMIWFDDSGKYHGDNTDGVGLIQDICVNHNITVAGRRILLLGAGGAAKGIIGLLLDEAPKELVVANRTPEKAKILVEQCIAQGGIQENSIRWCGLTELGAAPFDLIINATSASLSGEIPPLPDTILRPHGWCYDLMYDVSRPTAFVLWGKHHGASKSVDGLGMLVEQAAEAFHLWRGVRPDTGPVIAALRSSSSC